MCSIEQRNWGNAEKFQQSAADPLQLNINAHWQDGIESGKKGRNRY
jgi:hypothetical protein